MKFNVYKWETSHPVRVVFKGDNYLVHGLNSWHEASGINRYYTDDTLPDEIKGKLGMALFGMTGNGVIEVVRDVDGPVHWVDLWISIRTYRSIKGDRERDARSESKNQSEEDFE